MTISEYVYACRTRSSTLLDAYYSILFSCRVRVRIGLNNFIHRKTVEVHNERT